jgi:hypothetical protein
MRTCTKQSIGSLHSRTFTQSKFATRDEFCDLLVASRKVIRADVPAKGLFGLIDIATKTRFLIPQNELHVANEPSR